MLVSINAHLPTPKLQSYVCMDIVAAYLLFSWAEAEVVSASTGLIGWLTIDAIFLYVIAWKTPRCLKFEIGIQVQFLVGCVHVFLSE